MKTKTLSNAQVLALLRARGKALTASGSFSTGRNYLSTASSFNDFLSGVPSLGAQRFGPVTLRLYGNWLLEVRGVSRNTRTFYFRNLRAAWHAAGGDPAVFAPALVRAETTRKRALSPRALVELRALPLQGRQALWRDLFLFSFMARGMAFVDMAYLRKRDIADGYIRYTRRKTGQALSVRVEPGMGEILDKWRSDDGSPFVFPVVRSVGQKGYRQYASGLGSYNRTLHALGLELGCAGLTGYAARHSWATSARRAGVPVAVISEGMGHCSERTTRIYLASFEETLLDEANRRVLKHVGL